MRTDRAEFDKKTREAAWQRAGGKCEICTADFAGRRPDYHHRIAAALGGDNSLQNCRVICSKCHKEITDTMRGGIDKAKRIEEKRANTRQPKWKQRMSGVKVVIKGFGKARRP